MKRVAVVGSGPSGLYTVAALLASGLSDTAVLIHDGGDIPDPASVQDKRIRQLRGRCT